MLSRQAEEIVLATASDEAPKAIEMVARRRVEKVIETGVRRHVEKAIVVVAMGKEEGLARRRIQS